MQHENKRDVRIHPTTGEVYVSYPRAGKPQRGCWRRFLRWVSQQFDNHIDRLVALRVYDDRRYDYRIK